MHININIKINTNSNKDPHMHREKYSKDHLPQKLFESELCLSLSLSPEE